MELSGILPEDHIAYGKHGPDAHIPLSLRYADLTHPSTSTLTLLWDVWQLDQPIEHHVSARTRSMDRHFGHDPHVSTHPLSDSSEYSKNCQLSAAWRAQGYRHHLVWTCLKLQHLLGEQLLPKRPTNIIGGEEGSIHQAVTNANTVKEQGNQSFRKGDYRKALLRFFRAFTALIPYNTDASTMTSDQHDECKISETELALVWNICRTVVLMQKSTKRLRQNVIETIYAFVIVFLHTPYTTFPQHVKTVKLTEEINVECGLNWPTSKALEPSNPQHAMAIKEEGEVTAQRTDGRCCDTALKEEDGRMAGQAGIGNSTEIGPKGSELLITPQQGRVMLWTEDHGVTEQWT